MADAARIGPGGGMQEKEEIAAGYEGVGQPSGAAVYGHVRGQRGIGQLPEEIDIKERIRAEARFPVRADGGNGPANVGAAAQLHSMPLPIVKTKRQHRGKAGQRPGQTGGGILPARKDDERGLIAQRGFRLMDTGVHGVDSSGEEGKCGAEPGASGVRSPARERNPFSCAREHSPP